MRSRLIAVLAFATLLLVAAPAFAGPVTFNFGQHGNGDLGPGTVAFTAGGLELDVTAWLNNGTQTDVFYKNDGSDEIGLGINQTVDNEINFPNQFLQFDLSKLASLGSLQLTVGFNSTTGGETWQALYSNTNGQNVGTVAGTGSTETTITVNTASGHYLDLSSIVGTSSTSGGNVLVASATASAPTPEPSSLLLIGSGLISLAGVARRKMSK